MLDFSPKPLSQDRLERLVHGLRERLSSSAQRLTAELEGLQQKLRELDESQRAALERLEQAAESERQATLTAWDESLHRGWDQAEQRAYSAVFGTARRIGSLRHQARKQVELLNSELKKRASEIEQAFMRAKDAPIQRLNHLRSELQELADQLLALQAAGQTALAQRSLRTPAESQPPIDIGKPATAEQARRLFENSIDHARRHAERLAHPPVAKFVESLWWWLICGAVFIVVAGGLALLTVPFLVAVLAGATTSVFVFTAGLIAVRPWLARLAASEYPRLIAWVQAGQRLRNVALQLAIKENDDELKRLARLRDERFGEAKLGRERQVQQLTIQLQHEITELQAQAESEKQQARRELTAVVEEVDARFAQRMRDAQQKLLDDRVRLAERLESEKSSLATQLDALSQNGAQRLQVGTQKALQVIARSRRWCDSHFPEWQQWQSEPEMWPEQLDAPVIPLGWIPLESLLPQENRRDLSPRQLQAPLLFTPLQDEYLTVTGASSASAVTSLVRDLLMRALTTLPPGKTEVCVVDPPGLGSDFGWLMHLGDYDPQLVTHRVWTQNSHIARQMSSLATAAEDFIQQSLRNQYLDIAAYNREAGALAEPYRILVWNSFPAGLDDQAWRALQSILDTGARCGIIAVLIVDPVAPWPTAEMRDAVLQRGVHLQLDERRQVFSVNSSGRENLTVQRGAAISPQFAQHLIGEVGRRAMLASRVEVPLANMLPTPECRWQADSSLCLEIPIGQSGVGRIHSLKLGLGTGQHAIVAGKTGSGKSTLLHALITSGALKYSPADLRFVLLDFKKGVEFQIYSDCQLPHADIIGIESHREFGLSALQYLDACLQRRGELFRKAGVQDIAGWNALKPDNHVPRVLVVIDEFQELFVEDDRVSAQASLILDRIVRQGRSFGIHAILSSQTLSGAYSLPRTTLGQMAVRIALQCDSADAEMIFAEDNQGAARLKHPGQAVYNDAGGRIEGNQPMQIGWLRQEQQREWFSELGQGYSNPDPTTNRLGRCVVYAGHQAAHWSADSAELAIAEARHQFNPEAWWCVVGESVAISPAVVFPVTPQAGRNVLIVGNEDPQAAAVMDTIVASFVKATIAEQPQLVVVQGAKPTDSRALSLPKRWRHLPCSVTAADARQVHKSLKLVHEELSKRIEAEDADRPSGWQPMLLALIGIGRMRELRKSDDFSFNLDESSETSVDKLLEEILRDGPGYGVHTMIWADSYSTVNRWLSRAALREVEIRLLMQMSANDSTSLIDSVAASRLGEHVMLLVDEATGQEHKFRPFAFETLDDIHVWISPA